MRLLGRESELARLAIGVHEVSSGRGRAVLIEGEPGIGKSALLRAAADQAAQSGCAVCRGAGDELGQAFPLLPLLDAFAVQESPIDPRRAEQALAGKGADPAVAAAAALLALIDLQCAESPTVLVVDDLHWADIATVSVCDRLARSSAQRPLLLIGAMRPLPRRGDLKTLRRAVGRDNVISADAQANSRNDAVVAYQRLARALDHERSGALTDALAVLLVDDGDLQEIEVLLSDAVRLAVAVGDLTAAREVAARAEALPSQADVPHRAAIAAHCRGLLDTKPELLLRAAGRYADARPAAPGAGTGGGRCSPRRSRRHRRCPGAFHHRPRDLQRAGRRLGHHASAGPVPHVRHAPPHPPAGGAPPPDGKR